MRYKHHGFSLASLSVALMMMGLLTYSINNLNETKRSSLAYETVVASSVVLGKAVNTYYVDNCASGTSMSSPSVNSLITDGYIPSASAIDNRMGIDFTPQIVNPGTSSSMIYITANVSTVGTAQQLVDMASNASRTGSTVTFQFKPSTSTTASQARVHEMNEYFGETYCN